MRHTADPDGVFFSFIAVILYRCLERFEGIDGLLKDFNNRYATDILGTCLAHQILCLLIFHHQLCIFAAHHREHGSHGDHGGKQAGGTHTPVKHEHQHQHPYEHCSSAHDISKIVREQSLCLGGASVQTVPQKPGAVAVKEPERSLHQPCNTLLAYI